MSTLFDGCLCCFGTGVFVVVFGLVFDSCFGCDCSYWVLCFGGNLDFVVVYSCCSFVVVVCCSTMSIAVFVGCCCCLMFFVVVFGWFLFHILLFRGIVVGVVLLLFDCCVFLEVWPNLVLFLVGMDVDGVCFVFVSGLVTCF